MLAWLFGGGLSAVAKLLTGAYQARADAKTDQERIAAEERIARLEAQKDVLIAEQGSWLTSWIRPAIAFPVAVYINKVVVWDMILGWGTTPPLGEQMFWVMTVVVGAYFLTRPFEKVFRK